MRYHLTCNLTFIEDFTDLGKAIAAAKTLCTDMDQICVITDVTTNTQVAVVMLKIHVEVF